MYKQKRVGKDGKVFDMYKFRTMYNDTSYNNNETAENDPRLTRVGKIIRPLSLDELPQILNIIKNEMSFIGPRPLSVEHHEKLIKDLSVTKIIKDNLVPKVNPGILGWAIFRGREKITLEDRYNCNKEYEDNVSLLFDSYISWLTFKHFWISYTIFIFLFITIPLLILYLF